MTEIEIIKKGFRCEVCRHEWIPHLEEPVVCPECKSPYWNKSKKNKRRRR